MSNVLNPLLYNVLRGAFGDVDIHNQGDGNLCSVVERMTPRGLVKRTEVSSGGEYYGVNCPFCKDTSRRLWIHHLFGVPVAGAGTRPLNHMAVCYNEQCTEDPVNRESLRDKILDALGGRRAIIQPGRIVETGSLEAVELPGQSMPLDRLPSDHPARVYMLGRGYDLSHLSAYYNVRGITQASPRWSWMTGHVLIPIVMRGRVVGWQTRYPGDIDFKTARIPKYYGLPCMPKRLMLYNYDAAVNYPTVVVVEGVTSVWRLGGPSVALFGKTISQQQRRELLQWRQIILMFDADDHTAQQKMQEEYEELNRLKPGCVAQVHLPQGTDPGLFDRQTLWPMIRQGAKAYGMALDIKRRDRVVV